MAAATIDFSIDLGVTNSRIAVARNGAAQVVLNGEGLECTPTAVWCDERERLIVGSLTRDRLVDDAANVADRFRAQLGTGEVFRFARQNRPAEPEDLAAEVIGSLCTDARRRTGRDVSAAVLTAPTSFAAAQRDALVAAARRAGVAVSLLLQESVAAAFAYGGPAANACWLVYDFGGVSFEAALVTLEDGVLQVANHAGDSRLGGEVVDWAVVDKLLIPAVAAQFAVTGFRRDNAKWQIAVAKLKVAAEEARIRLDRETNAQIVVPFLCRDDSGAPVRFRHVLTRGELDALLEPVVRRSLKVCERLLGKRNLGFDDLERVVVSGGPVRDPYFARLLAEQGGGLDKRIASSVDPFTAVVQGAALYAGSEPVERVAPPVFVAGQEVVSEPEAEVVEEIAVAEPVTPDEVAAEAPAEVSGAAPRVAPEEVPEVEPEEAPAAEEMPAVEEELEEAAEQEPAEPAIEAQDAPEVAAEEMPAVEEEVEEAAEQEPAEPAVEAEDAAAPEEAPEVAPEAVPEGVFPRAMREEPQVEAAPEVPEADEPPVSWEPERPAPLLGEPAAAEPAQPRAEGIGPAEEPPGAPDMWIGAPWEREIEAGGLTGEVAVPDEHASSEGWRPVSEEAEAAQAAARAEETEPDRESAVAWAIEVEKGGPVEAEQAVAAEAAGEAWDLVPDEGAFAGAEEQAEPVEWAPVERGPLPPAERGPLSPAEPVAPAPPLQPLPPRTGAPGGTLEETIVARAASLVKTGRYKDAKRLVDRLGPTETLSVQALDLLATIYTHEGQFDAAERVWRRAAGLDPAGHKGEPSLRRTAQHKAQAGTRRAEGRRRRVPPSVLAGSAAGVALIVIIVLIILWAHSCQLGTTTGVVASKSPSAVASRTTSVSPSATPSRSASATASPTPSVTGPPVLSLDVPGTQVSTQGDALEVTFDHGLFASGSAELAPDATDSLLALAQQLRPQAAKLWVRVTGHTDNVPVAQPFAYPDNVSLGMARAVAVVEFFRSQGDLPYVILSARSVDAIHPLGNNLTAAGRARNRTVVIAITRRTQ